MQIDHHDLHSEFPEFKDRISLLKTTDAHFAKLFDEYDTLDHEVRRIEQEDSPIGDAEMEAMKMNRVHLKDKLYAYLKDG